MTSKILIHLGTPEDEGHQYRLSGLVTGSQVAWKHRLTTPLTVRDLEDSMARVPGGVTGVVCTNQEFLVKLLHQQPDFLPPNNRRGITLDDYQGSLLFTPRDKVPVVFINPLKNLITVPWATAAAKRFLSKLTKPESFFPATKFTWVEGTPKNLPEILNHWRQNARIISVDIETIVGDPLRRISCAGYCAFFPATGTTECVVIPVTDEVLLEYIRQFNLLPQPKVMQNGLYDNLYFLRWNCPVYNWLHDTQHLFHSMFSEYPKRLDFITAYALREVRYWKDDGKTGNLRDYYTYNARDCWATLNSYLSLLGLAEGYAIRNYLKEFPLVFPSLHCEVEGFKWDEERAKVVKEKMTADVAMREAAFVQMIAAPGFNLNSPQQMAKLFKVLGCGSLGSTGAAAMLKAQAAHPLNNRILSEAQALKKLKKLISTYFAENKIWNGRLLYKINPAGTDTGRLASAESSFWCGLQIMNFLRGETVKQCAMSDPGWLLSEIDKAQSEARCVGYLSGDQGLIDLVEGPHDYHSWNASSFFGVPYEEIYNEVLHKTLNVQLRDLAKRTNHGANYNMGAWMMLETMGPKKVAQAKMILKLPARFTLMQVCQFMLDAYDRKYPAIKKDWYDAIIKEISLTGRLVSPRGWTRIFFGRPSRENKPLLNAAVAHPAQNLSVDCINEELYNVWRASVYDEYYGSGGELVRCELRGKVRLKAQIHDSILFQYRENMPELPGIVAGIMNTRVKITDPKGITREMYIPVDISKGGHRWSELK